MAFAPHTNTDVQHQLRAGMVPAPLPLVLGSFKHKETDVFFEYGERRHPDDTFAPEACHMIFLINGETRLAIVRKTIAHVVVDEGADGPIWVKWPLKQHRQYETGWVAGEL